MQLDIFSVYDAAAKAYLQPMYSRSRGEALRMFTDAVNGKDSQFGRHPADYALVFLGTFDDVSGQFAPVTPEFVIKGTEVIVDDDIFPPSKRIP